MEKTPLELKIWVLFLFKFNLMRRPNLNLVCTDISDPSYPQNGLRKLGMIDELRKFTTCTWVI